MRRDVPLAGRGPELSAVAQAMVAGGRALAVAGPPGIGKTRLTEEAAEHALGQGVLTLVGQCLPLSVTLPLLPFGDVLRALWAADRGQWWRLVAQDLPAWVLRDVATLLPQLSDPEQVSEDAMMTEGHLDVLTSRGDDWHTARLFEAVHQTLTCASEHRSFAVVLEDLHWADPASRDLLDYLLAPVRVLTPAVVVTCRTDDESGAGGETLLRRLRTSSTCRVIDLVPLTPVEASAQVRAIAGERLDDGEVRAVVERSQGHPLYITQLVRAVLGGEVTAADRGHLPRGLEELLTASTRTVRGASRQVLICLAVTGPGADEDLLSHSCGLPLSTVRTALRSLTSAHLVRTMRGGGFGLSHALLAEAVLAAELSGDVRDWHRRVAGGLVAAGSTPPARVAEHWRAAGDTAEELPWRVGAARRAEEVFASAEAAVHWLRSASLARAAGGGAHDGMSPSAMDAAATQALKQGGDDARATELALAALDELGGDGDPYVRARLLASVGYHRGAGARSAGRESLRRAVAILEQLPPTEAYLHAAYDYWLYSQFSSSEDEAVVALDRALAAAPWVDAPGQRQQLLTGRAWVDTSRGEEGAALERLAQAAEIGRVNPDPEGPLLLALNTCEVLLRLGRLTDVDAPAAARLLREWSTRGRSETEITSILRANVTQVLLTLGDVAGAAELIDPVTQGVPTRDTFSVHAARARLDMLRGSMTAAQQRWALLPRLWDVAADIETQPARMEMDLWRHHPQVAIAHAQSLLDSIEESSETRLTGPLLLLAARASADIREQASDPHGREEKGGRGLAQDLNERRARMRDDPLVAGPLRPTGHADGLVWEAEWGREQGRSDPPAWRAPAEEYEAHGHPHQAAYCRWRQAETMLRQGCSAGEVAPVLRAAARQSSSHAPLTEAVQTLALRGRIRLDPAPASRRRAAAERPGGLTPRELTVLQLVARGETNTSIGQALFISDKTVSVHVSNLMRKLDVGNRVEAAVVAEQRGLLTGDE